MESPAAIGEIKAEMIDRFGPLPAEMKHLFIKMLFRVYCLAVGILKIDLADQRLVLKLSPQHVPNPSLLSKWVVHQIKAADVTRNWLITVPMASKQLAGQLRATKNILKEIFGHVTS